jgi:hypothetical protein
MLTELLDTRVMVKHAMKGAKGSKVSDPNSSANIFKSLQVFITPPERPTTGPQVHCKCHLRLHERNVRTQ